MGHTGNTTPGFAAGAGKQLTQQIAGKAKENCVCVSMCVFREGRDRVPSTQSTLLPSKKKSIDYYAKHA